MQDPAFADSLASTTKNVETLTARLNKGEGTAGKLLTDDGLYKRIDALTGRLETLTTDSERGQGHRGRVAEGPAAVRQPERRRQRDCAGWWPTSARTRRSTCA